MTQPYTVLVLRPDYESKNYGQDTFLAHVDAYDAAHAQRLAQKEAADADESTEPDDYHVLLVIEGHHYDRRVDE
jgi:hypothetical protein